MVMVEAPSSLRGGIKGRNSQFGVEPSAFSQRSAATVNCLFCSCGASPTRAACRYLRRGRRVTGRGRSETPPTGTDPHSHLRDRN